MDYAVFHIIFTVAIFAAFVGLVVWLFVYKRKPDFDQAANAIFADEQKPQQKIKQESDHE